MRLNVEKLWNFHVFHSNIFIVKRKRETDLSVLSYSWRVLFRPKISDKSDKSVSLFSSNSRLFISSPLSLCRQNI